MTLLTSITALLLGGSAIVTLDQGVETRGYRERWWFVLKGVCVGAIVLSVLSLAEYWVEKPILLLLESYGMANDFVEVGLKSFGGLLGGIAGGVGLMYAWRTSWGRPGRGECSEPGRGTSIVVGWLILVSLVHVTPLGWFAAFESSVDFGAVAVAGMLWVLRFELTGSMELIRAAEALDQKEVFAWPLWSIRETRFLSSPPKDYLPTLPTIYRILAVLSTIFHLVLLNLAPLVTRWLDVEPAEQGYDPAWSLARLNLPKERYMIRWNAIESRQADTMRALLFLSPVLLATALAALWSFIIVPQLIQLTLKKIP